MRENDELNIIHEAAKKNTSRGVITCMNCISAVKELESKLTKELARFNSHPSRSKAADKLHEVRQELEKYCEYLKETKVNPDGSDKK